MVRKLLRNNNKIINDGDSLSISKKPLVHEAALNGNPAMY